MVLLWTASADRDMDNIAIYLGRENPPAAIKLLKKIEASADGLIRNPKLGKQGREPGTRERVVVSTPFVLVYELSGLKIIILRVLHSAQEWPIVN